MTSGPGHCVDGDGRLIASWGVAGCPKANEPESGDTCVLLKSQDWLLVAAIDGAGHGTEAAAAARTAESILARHVSESPISLILKCHEGLRRTRGVVMTLAYCHLGHGTLTWLGIGNVNAVLFHGSVAGPMPSDRIVLRGGVVGYQLPPLRAEVLPLRPFDTLIMATDGIEEHFADNVTLTGEPQEIADRILAAHRKDTDDALVLVLRYLGTAALGVAAHDRP
jgi:hypothetical protein